MYVCIENLRRAVSSRPGLKVALLSVLRIVRTFSEEHGALECQDCIGYAVARPSAKSSSDCQTVRDGCLVNHFLSAIGYAVSFSCAGELTIFQTYYLLTERFYSFEVFVLAAIFVILPSFLFMVELYELKEFPPMVAVGKDFFNVTDKVNMKKYMYANHDEPHKFFWLNYYFVFLKCAGNGLCGR